MPKPAKKSDEMTLKDFIAAAYLFGLDNALKAIGLPSAIETKILLGGIHRNDEEFPENSLSWEGFRLVGVEERKD